MSPIKIIIRSPRFSSAFPGSRTNTVRIRMKNVFISANCHSEVKKKEMQKVKNVSLMEFFKDEFELKMCIVHFF